MTKGKIIFTSIIILVVLILGIIKYKNVQLEKSKEIPPEKPGSKIIKATAFIIEASELNNDISVSGSILAQDEVSLQPEVSGRIIQLNIQEGSIVSKGTLLMKINDADLKAQLEKVKAQLKVAQSNLKRVDELLRINGISQAEHDIAENQVTNLNADINVLQVQIAKTELRAPFNGKLGLRNVSIGAYVSPNTIVATLQNISQLKLDVSIPERYAYLVKIGDLMDCSIDGDVNTFQAKVIATEPQIDETTRNLKVRALVIKPNERLIPGTYVKVNFKLKETQNAILIPSNAIIPDDKANKVVVVENGKAKFIPIIQGVRTAESVEVLSGLKVGDTVLSSGLLQAKPNINVKVTKIISVNPLKNN